ncbi:hypothetical protein [Legionella cincinnatiensis]|uniref:Transmembrane protein (Fibronectin III domain and Gp5 C-terminal repeat) n=1 Tax=Legionella cincinnatiensis TaxID=28085 RepID=A0A378IIK2_9GAMM|nr:hypothetical protein [Legionella cincinnatiensis]KTC91762.1 hypothetical protein Lcin_1162 [Legionella cincinnatiensis]STX34535.1 transmembrane protein (fibronectin III domain and Gp5 C-terminal repeat) [Legionella cincinnatiensis]
MKRLSINKIITGVLLFLMITIVQAQSPLWTFTPDNNFPPVVKVSSTGNATIKYVIQNRSSKPHSLVIKPIPGISQTAPCVVKGKGVCNLELTVTGSALPTNGVFGGPSLCQKNANGTPNPNQCYQPSPGNLLQVTTVSGPTASITVNPNLLNLTAGGNYGQVTVQNLSATTAVEGLRAVIPQGSQLTVDSTHTTCTNTLPANQSCIFAFLPGNTVEDVNIEITGSNVTSAVPVEVKVSSASQVTITVNPSQLTLTVNGASGQVSVHNTSAATAVEGLNAVIPSTSQVTIDPSHTTCTNTLAANQNCIFGFLPGNVAENIIINISGSNTTSSVPVSVSVTNNTMSSLAYVGALAPPYVNLCTITNGSFNTACQQTGDYNFTQSIIQIVINSIGSKAYLVQFDSQGNPLPVIVCNITPQGNLAACVNADDATHSLLSLALSTSGKAYFTTNITPPANSSSIYSCDVDSMTGLFTNCNSIFSFDSNVIAPGITLSTDNQKAYVSYNGFNAGTFQDGVYECDLTSNSCIPRPMTRNFTNWFFGNIVLNPTHNLLYMVGNQDNDQSRGDIFVCDPSTDPMECGLSFTSLGNGIVFGSNIAFGEKIVFGHSQPQLYVTTPNTVTSCDLDNNGGLNNCTQGSATITGASGLAVNPNT